MGEEGLGFLVIFPQAVAEPADDTQVSEDDGSSSENDIAALGGGAASGPHIGREKLADGRRNPGSRPWREIDLDTKSGAQGDGIDLKRV